LVWIRVVFKSEFQLPNLNVERRRYKATIKIVTPRRGIDIKTEEEAHEAREFLKAGGIGLVASAVAAPRNRAIDA